MALLSRSHPVSHYVHVAVRRGLTYAILSVLIGLLYGAVLWALSLWTGRLHAGLTSGLIFVFLVGLVYAPSLSYLQRAVDRLFFRQAADRQRMIEQFAHESAAAIDLDALARALCNLVERSLKPRHISLYLDDGRGVLVHFCSHDSKYLPGQWPDGMRLPAEYSVSGKTAARVRVSQREHKSEISQITGGDVALAVPIIHRSQQLGCLLLESRRADEPYDDEEVRLAEAIAAQSAVALQNARSFAQLERHQNLARIGEAISTLNHEIKNVLQPVRHQVNRLAELESADPAVKSAMEVIPERLGTLDKLLSNLKDLSRPVELRVREVDLQDLSASAWRDVQELPAAKGVSFTSKISADCKQCRADGHWLRQVLFHLMRNGIEAMNGQSHPEITLETSRADRESRIVVKDNGCGMDAEAQNHLFSMFHTTKCGSGTGLGLSLCRKIVELHGGRIQIFSQTGNGTAVTISLPGE